MYSGAARRSLTGLAAGFLSFERRIVVVSDHVPLVAFREASWCAHTPGPWSPGRQLKNAATPRYSFVGVDCSSRSADAEAQA